MLDPSCGAASNPFLANLLSQGHIRRDPTGVGFEVDVQCRPVGKGGAGVDLVGAPSELVLFLIGRQAHALVELVGPEEITARMRTARYGI